MKRRVKREAGIEAAIQAAGGLSELARKLRISPSSIVCWPRIPARRVLEIERVTGLSRHVMDPILYPKED